MKSQINQFFKIFKEYENRILLTITLITIFLRFIYVCIAFPIVANGKWSDSPEYLIYGEQIAQGNWYPVRPGSIPYMQVAPAIPIIIAGSIKYFGNTLWPVFIYNIIITSLAVLILFQLGKLVFNRKVGWFFLIWTIFYVDYYKLNPYLMKEPTLYFFLPLVIFLLLKSIKENGRKAFMFFSAITYVWLIHADERFLIYFPFFAFSFFIMQPYNFKKSSLLALFWISIVILMMIPWTFRNYNAFGQIVLISPRTTAFTSMLWGKNISNLNFSEKPDMQKREDYNLQRILKMKEEFGISPRKFGKFEKYFKAFINFWQPAYFKAGYIGDGFYFQKWSLKHNMIGILFYGIFLPFFIFGIILLIKRKNQLGLFLASIPIIHSLIHIYMIWPLERYRSPINFIVVMIGLWAMLFIYEEVKKRFKMGKYGF